MMSIKRQIKIQKLQNKNRMVGKQFSTLGNNERRKHPWLGVSWFEPGREKERAIFIKDWEEETDRLLSINPNLKII